MKARIRLTSGAGLCYGLRIVRFGRQHCQLRMGKGRQPDCEVLLSQHGEWALALGGAIVAGVVFVKASIQVVGHANVEPAVLEAAQYIDRPEL